MLQTQKNFAKNFNFSNFQILRSLGIVKTVNIEMQNKWIFERNTGMIINISLGSRTISEHQWSNGMIIAFQAVDPGSTPG